MVKPIVYGSEGSPAVRSVLLTAYAIDLDFDLKRINIHANEHKTEEFLKKNPQHTVPIFEDNERCIWDSHAIVTYLVSKYGKNDSLYPKDLFERAVVDQRLHFESGVLSPKGRAFFEAMKSGNTENMEKTKNELFEVFDFLEKFLGNNSHLAGNSLTVADFSILSTLSTLNLFCPVDSGKFPKVCDWLRRMAKLPFYEKGNAKGLREIEEYARQKMSPVQVKH